MINDDLHQPRTNPCPDPAPEINAPRTMDLIILCGLPGVGKLTVAKELANLSGYANFHNHLVVDAITALFPFGAPAFVELRERVWTELLSRAAFEGVGGVIFTFAFDKTVRDDFLLYIEEMIRSFGGRVTCIELVCSRDEFERRIVQPTRANHGKLNSLEFFNELEQSGSFVRQQMPAETVTIDTTFLTPNQAALKIIEFAKV